MHVHSKFLGNENLVWKEYPYFLVVTAGLEYLLFIRSMSGKYVLISSSSVSWEIFRSVAKRMKGNI